MSGFDSDLGQSNNENEGEMESELELNDDEYYEMEKGFNSSLSSESIGGNAGSNKLAVNAVLDQDTQTLIFTNHDRDISVVARYQFVVEVPKIALLLKGRPLLIIRVHCSVMDFHAIKELLFAKRYNEEGISQSHEKRLSNEIAETLRPDFVVSDFSTKRG